ncbi:replication licensing factor Cdt1 [Entomophthora muscae]|uniref:Replication licensing factor Cdt1 n=1 Tax=Entomophthora muscae TaxID=34485 RepID=A0ACC2TPZ1_9FUNG|nr:replication licensing factor Cdt1 [Entomophthora muscae]
MMSLTPKTQTLKGFFLTKKPTYETRSKRKLELASLAPITDKADPLTLETKKGKINTPKAASPASTTAKQSAPSKQATLLNFLIPKPSAPLPISAVVTESQPLEAKPPTLVNSKPHLLNGPSSPKATLSVPAYLRYASFSCAGPIALPEHLSSLEKNFKFMFHTMLYQRVMWNTFTFHQLQPAIEKTSKRSFPMSQLGQFKELFPDLFEFEPTKATHNYKTVDSVFIKVPSLGLGCQVKGDQDLDIYPTERIEMLCKELHTKLVNIVHKHHNDFLLGRSLPTFANPPSKWHPAFDLTSVPHVVSQPLFPVAEPVAPRATLAERAKLLLTRDAVPTRPMGILERAKALLNKKASPVRFNLHLGSDFIGKSHPPTIC